ncbi:uncharacterized protein B0P05DRAFT_577362 [Gilbertella persicaria]|uniref:uncharacterized protein n=1 Tax=Gilbertella persicaria TaxID=101096 RepID=UPI00221FA644|nr:uncharacterized protein B0P05DRAFT_577362 [Gilbertella persicaria]KAI8091312.1 hypothetical protein B0P05DRAFT_577362 [Gilbertella persicaria]
MFRPNTTADLNEFPALGTPPTRNMNSRLGTSYASTAGNHGFQQGNDLEDLKNNLAFNRTNFANNPPRSFSMDEFPALRSSATPFDNAIGRESVSSTGKPEQWLDYANLRDSQPQGKPFPEKATAPSGSADSWTRKQQQDEANDAKSTDPYGLLGLLGVIRMTDPDRSMLALGSDLTTLGLDLNTAE